MKIAILAPSHKSFIARFLSNYESNLLPEGYWGAPFIGILIDEILMRGHEVVAITTSVSDFQNENTQEFTNGRFKWIIVPRRRHSFSFNKKRLGFMLDFFSMERKQIKRVVLAEKPDFIHAHWSYEFPASILNLSTPYLVTVHDNAFLVFRYFRNVFRFFRLLMSEWVLRRVSFASTVSPYMLPYVENRCKKVKVIANPVVIDKDIEEIKRMLNHKLASIHAPILMMVFNGWEYLKNGEAGLLAFNEICKRFPEAKLKLFGRGTEIEGPAYHFASEHGISRIDFIGAVEHSKLLQYYKDAHLLMHPSLEESFGVVLIEAMANGTPVIGGKHSGAVPWVIGNGNLLIDVSKPGVIAAKAIEILNRADCYEEIGIECYLHVANNFSVKAVVDQYLSYYSEIVKNECI